MATVVSIQQGGTGANNASDAVNALGTIANTGGIFTGEVQFTGSNNSINVANSAIISGNANVSGNLRVTNQGFFGNGLAAHIATNGIEANTMTIAGFANTNGASEIVVINKSNGSLAYSEFIALNDRANQEQGWISVGVNSSEYNDPEFTLTGPDDGYLLFEPPLNSNANGDLIIGTGSNGLNNHIKFAAGGFEPTDAQMIISPADLKTAEIVLSQLTSNVATLTTANTHTFIANDEVIIESVGSPYDGTFTIIGVTSNTFTYAVTNSNLSPAAETGTATQYLPFNKGTVELTAQLFVGENSKSTIETADITLVQGHAIPLGIVVDNDGPGQTVMFNKSNGTLAYSEFIAHNDAGNVEMGWISMGINSSGYDDPEYPITKADDAYLLYEPPANTTGDGDLIIGTGTNGTKNRLIFAAEGFDEANAQMIITPNESVRIAINTNASNANSGALQVEGGIGVQGSVFVQGNQTIQGDLIVNGSQVIQSIASVAAAGPISILGDGNIANTWDFGVVGTYAVSKSVGSVAITNKELANNQATLTANNHGFAVEDYVVVVGTGAPFEGTHRVTAVTSNTFSYFKLANNISSTSASGSVSVSSRAKYTGAIKDTANATWKLLSNIETRPDFTVNLANTALDSLRVATINADSFVTATGVNIGNLAANAVLRTGDTMTGELKLLGSGVSLNVANVGYFSGNVGIGTTNPGYKLDVNGTISASGELITLGNDARISLYRSSGINYFDWSSGQSLYLSTQTSSGGAGRSTKMVLLDGGNVGIGTTSPLNKLDVRGTVGIGTAQGNLENILKITATNTSANNHEVTFAGPSTGTNDSYTFDLSRAGGAYGGIDVKFNGTSRFFVPGSNLSNNGHAYINPVNNVGIGTTSPEQKLHVLGGIRSTTSSTTGFGLTETLNDLGTMVLQVGIFGSARSGTTFGLDNANLAFIYTTTYSTGHPSALAIGTSSSQPLVFGTAATERMRITEAGTVGIGTTSPNNARFHVAGVNTSPDLSTASVTNASAVLGNSDPDYGMYFATYGAGNGAIQQRRGATAVYYDLTLQPHGGNVGIGTLTPAVKFHVAGASIIANNTSIDPDSYANQIVAGAIADGSGWGLTSAIGGNAGTGDSWAIGHNGSALYFGMQNGSAADTMQTYIQFDSNRNLYLVPTSGNIGIGTGTPSAKLTVYGTTESNYFDVNASNGTAGLADNINAMARFINSSDGATVLIKNNNSSRTDAAVFSVWNQSNSRFIILNNGNIGIGTTSPASKLDVNGIINSNASGTGTLYLGYTTSSSRVAARITGVESPSYNATGKIGFSVTTWGVGSDYGLTEVMAIDMRGADSKNPTIWMNPFGGNVGIGTTSPSRRLHIYGDFNNDSALRLEQTDSNDRLRLDLVHPSRTFTMSNNGANWSIEHNGTDVVTVSSGGSMTLSGTLTENSSIAIKENVDPINNALDAVVKLVGVTYDRIDGSAKKRAGLIAEEVEKVLPNVVQKDEQGNPSGIQYTNLIAYLIESIKELKAEIDVLKSK